MAEICGTDSISGPKPPKPGDPDNNVTLSAFSSFGGIDISWTYPQSFPHAVAHTLLYRANSADFNSAVQLAVVAGNFYYDKHTVEATYYYWIKIISVNGTVGALIGPASATVRLLIQDLITSLTGRIDAGFLAQHLKTSIDRIFPLGENIAKEIIDRLQDSAAILVFLKQVQSDVDSSVAFITKEITDRVTANSALLKVIDTVGVAVNNNSAAIQVETTARVDANKIIAEQITTVQSGTATNLATVQTTLQTNIGLVNGRVTTANALWSTRVNVNGVNGGFGIFNDGVTVEAGFDVDSFWIGRTNSQGMKPFIVENGIVFINSAVIKNLSVDRLKITGLLFFSGMASMSNGVMSGTFFHYSGRKILVYVLMPANNTFPLVGANIFSMTDDSFGFHLHGFTKNGVGFTGQFPLQWGYI